MLNRMTNRSLRLTGILILASVTTVAHSTASAAGQQSPAPGTASAQRTMLNRYCVTCHNERLRTADLLLDQANVENVDQDAETWEKAIRKLRAGQMPPPGAPRPDQEVLDQFASYLSTSLDQAAEASPNPGRALVHRLNRAEYSGAIRDLLAVEINGTKLLPADNAEHGFDNIADVLTVSPLLMERYMLAARKITRIAAGDPTLQPAGETYKVEPLLDQDIRASDRLPFGSRGGLAVEHRFPLDGEYVIKIRLQRNNDGYIRGLREPQKLDFRVDAARVGMLTVGGEFLGRSGPIFSRNDPDYRGDPAQVDYEYSADDDMEVRFQAEAGTRLVGVSFLGANSKPEGFYMPPLLYGDKGQYRGGNAWIDTVTITGPFQPRGPGETLSRGRIFICQPATSADEKPCAEKILSALARRAYRRPLADADVKALMGLYEQGAQDQGFEAGVRLGLERILAGPEFLFRLESDPAGAEPGSVHPVSDMDLASRLSFFLWSSLPDDELLDLAEQGRLRDRAVMQQQVERMMGDPRSEALVENFAAQWLSLRQMELITPDLDVYPDFDENLRQAFLTETKMLFSSILRDDRSLMDLLRADFTFVNERLARHYGIPDVYGSNFRRVPVIDEARKGLLGQGSILTVTSRVNRTSPVLRGKWVLENLLGTPPPPPPPDVPSLEAQDQGGRAMTLRQQMEAHRTKPSCIGCHKLMDPIGFALEVFDGIGKSRTHSVFGDESVPIDPSGILPDGTAISGPVEFRQVLLSRPELFLNTATEKLLTFALGRGLDYNDYPAIRRILRESSANDYRWSSIITGIVNSVPFQMRRLRELP